MEVNVLILEQSITRLEEKQANYFKKQKRLES